MIDVQALGKRYGDLAALDGATFRVERGDIVGFLGPNGAGKTTTLRILSTYLVPSEGSASVAGFDVVDAPEEVRRRLGYLPENPPLYLDHTVDEFLGFCAALRGVPRRRRGDAVASAAQRCGLAGVRGRLLGNLSKGFRQRVGLAQALVHEPEVVILDEPTVGLDPAQIVEIRELIRGLAPAHTVLLSSHLLSEVAKTCSRIVVVHRGRVVGDDTVEGLRAGGSLEEAFLRLTSEDPAT